jgi:nitrogen fixation NifU-like protein
MAFEDLYQEIILDHYRHPRNFDDLSDAGEQEVYENPTCGDSVKLVVDVDESGVVRGIRYNSRGCAISVASASLMSERLKGLLVQDALEKVDDFMQILRGENKEEGLKEWGDLVALEGVAQYPLRIKCATLAWHALRHALEKAAAGQGSSGQG